MKLTKETLRSAADNNIIQPEQVDPLYDYISKQNNSGTYGREEPLRFIRSFGDIFITIGIIFFVISINILDLTGLLNLIPVILFVILAEWLVRVRRLALPGIAILLSILFLIINAVSVESEMSVNIQALIIAVTSLMFYLRYSMPFSLLPIAVSLVVLFINLFGEDAIKSPGLFALSGFFVFIAAMWFDSKDTSRISHLSDSAFWLHLLAAPLLVHGLMLSMLTSEIGWTGFTREILIICFFLVFFLIALLIDRRALLISTQLYMIFAVTRLFNDIVGIQNIMILVFFFLGLFVIYFGAYWYKTRQYIFRKLTGKKITNYLPDLELKDNRKSR